jgi:hypothetical protein
VAYLINCQPHDILVLVAVRLLKPLGNPPSNGIKYFAASELLEQVKDRTWLAKVTNALNQHWQKKNAANKTGWRMVRRMIILRQLASSFAAASRSYCSSEGIFIRARFA